MARTTATIKWHVQAWSGGLRVRYRRNIANACAYLVKVIRADISQKGSLIYRVGEGYGRGRRYRTVKVLNFTHSSPGNPPYLQTGALRKSIDWSVFGDRGIVGTDIPYGRYLENGTSKMKPRPYLKVNVRRHRATIRTILARPLTGVPLPKVSGSQLSRSGILGAGAKRLGYH